MRRLMLHMGLTKTGSTAIQTWCVWNRDFLADHGVRYPEHPSDQAARRGAPLPGNGTPLLPFLGAPARMDRAAADRGIDQVVADLLAGGAPLTLASNEKMWGQFRPAKLRGLAERIRAEGVTPQAVVYLRDIAGHAVSVYVQRVQQGAVRVPLEDYLDVGDGDARYEPRLRQTLENLLDILGPNNVIVRHYDSVRQVLMEDFLTEVLEIDSRDGATTPPAAVANRSLGLREVEWKRYLNARLTEDRNRSKNLGRQLTMLPGLDGDSRLTITPDALAFLDECHGAEVDWVNQQFFGGEPVLSVAGSIGTSPERAQPMDLSESERYLLDWIAGPGTT